MLKIKELFGHRKKWKNQKNRNKNLRKKVNKLSKGISEKCETCIKRKTMYCPNSIKCMATDDKPYYRNKIMLLEEAKELKKQLEDISEELELVRCDLHNRTSERDGYERELNECLSQQKEFIKYLEAEKDRLAREVSQIYEDSLGKTKLVNEDIFNEVNNVLSKYKEILSKGENK